MKEDRQRRTEKNNKNKRQEFMKTKEATYQLGQYTTKDFIERQK